MTPVQGFCIIKIRQISIRFSSKSSGRRQTPEKLAEQIFHIRFGKGFYKAAVIRDQFTGQFALALLQLQYFIFNGIDTDHAVSKDIFRLPYTVSTVDGLLFYSRVPPGINNINIIGSG